MEIKKKEIEVYNVGGKEFIDEKEAKQYEEYWQKKLSGTYYRVIYSPDLIEGRGYYKSMIIGVLGSFTSQNAVYHYLVENIGKPLEFVMGVAPIDNWIVGEGRRFDNINDLEKFLNEKVSIGIGDYSHMEKPKLVYIDKSGRQVGLS